MASKHWHLNSLEIQAAFLQGSEISREVYLKPPVEASTNKLWKLQKCVYGLTDASRLWYIRVREELAKLNVSKSKFDDAIFYYHKNNNLEGIISTHVDDVFWGDTQAFQENVIGFLKNIFRISKENQHSFVYLGLTMKQNECDIELNQDNYISEMSLVEIQNEQSRSPDDALNEDERKQLRTVIG